MIFNMIGMGGGASLNFAVYGGTSEPAPPKENDIWVNTDTEITSWVFSASQPQNVAEGMVCFTTGTNSSAVFNALKKNDIQVYPLAAKQYINGAWEGKAAKIYQNGEWVEWATFLYNNGDECIAVSGGFNAYAARVSGSGSTEKAPTLTKDATSMTTTLASGYAGAVYAEKQLQLDNLDRIEFVYSNHYNTVVGITSKKGSGFTYAAYSSTLSTDGTAVIDVSSMSGKYYFVIAQAGSGTKTITIHEIKLVEKEVV